MMFRPLLLSCLLASSTAVPAQGPVPPAITEAEARDSIATLFRSIDAHIHASHAEQNVQLALHAWAMAREQAPDEVEPCRLRLAQAYADLGLPEKALEHANAVLDMHPRTVRGLQVKAAALAAMGLHHEATTAWKELLSCTLSDAQRTEALEGAMRGHAALGELDEAVSNGQTVLALYRAQGDRTRAGICGNDLGQVLGRQKRHAEALARYTTAMDDLTDPPLRLVVASNRCAELVRLGRGPDALDELEVIRIRAIALGHASIADRALLLRSAALLLEGRSLDALEAAQTVQVSAAARGDTVIGIESCDLLAHISRTYGMDQQARAHATKAAALRTALHDRELTAGRTHAATLAEAQRYEAQYLQRSEEQQRERNQLRLLQHEADDKAQKLELVRIASDMRSADLQSAVLRAEAERRLALARSDLRAEQQKRIIRDLQISKTTQALELARSEQAQQAKQREVELLIRDKALQAAQLDRENAQQRTGIAVLLFLSLTVVGAVVWLVVMRRKNTVIRDQVQHIEVMNERLSAKHRDTLDSIRAAQQIQRTIIPTVEQLQQILPDSFLFYRPMDIVSGDLPFIRREGERLFIATIDCTGHGVPAAMLSFRAYYNLNDIITTHRDLDVGGILSVLHQRVLAEGQRTTNGPMMDDGMDITLVELDLDRRMLWYSGAQNSLLLVRDGICERIKGDNCSIGSTMGTTGGFRTNRIDLRSGDRVYLYSDGFVHQFGGPNGRKKFSNAQLMQAVSGLAGRSAAQAGEFLAEMHRDWRGQATQTDDIVLIGFSIDKRAAVRAA